MSYKTSFLNVLHSALYERNAVIRKKAQALVPEMLAVLRKEAEKERANVSSIGQGVRPSSGSGSAPGQAPGLRGVGQGSGQTAYGSGPNTSIYGSNETPSPGLASRPWNSSHSTGSGEITAGGTAPNYYYNTHDAGPSYDTGRSVRAQRDEDLADSHWDTRNWMQDAEEVNPYDSYDEERLFTLDDDNEGYDADAEEVFDWLDYFSDQDMAEIWGDEEQEMVEEAIPAQPLWEARTDKEIAGDLGDLGEGGQYTVSRGDTLGNIARAAGVSLDELLQANPDITDPNRISVGQNIILPTVHREDDFKDFVIEGDSATYPPPRDPLLDRIDDYENWAREGTTYWPTPDASVWNKKNEQRDPRLNRSMRRSLGM